MPRRLLSPGSRVAAAGSASRRRPPIGNRPAHRTPRPARRPEDTRRKLSLSYRDISKRRNDGTEGNKIISAVSYQPTTERIGSAADCPRTVPGPPEDHAGAAPDRPRGPPADRPGTEPETPRPPKPARDRPGPAAGHRRGTGGRRGPGVLVQAYACRCPVQ